MVGNTTNEYLVYSTISRPLFNNSDIEHRIKHILRLLKVRGSLSVHCIGDTRMRELNRTYRGKNKTTDVLSFPLLEGESAFAGKAELGDIFISIPQIRRQAKELGISPHEEFTRMLIHGILHILGYDHQGEKEARRMFSLQEKILTKLE